MQSGELLPIKVVLKRQEDYQTPRGGGGDVKFFGDVDDEVRDRLVAQVDAVGQHFAHWFADPLRLPGVAKVRLKEKALAKTHRPRELFNDHTCPIVGAGKLGELYVGVSKQGLSNLTSEIRSSTTKVVLARISSLESISAYESADVVGRDLLSLAYSKAAKRPSSGLRCRLFRFARTQLDKHIADKFIEFTKAQGGTAAALNYGSGLTVYRVDGLRPESVATLATFPSVQTIDGFPNYRVVRTASHPISKLSAEHLPPPVAGENYGQVGLIDSGTDPTNSRLQAWVASRLDLVPTPLQDNTHGTFVAGLLVSGRRLNHGNSDFPEARSRIVDVVAFDRSGIAAEYEILQAIDTALSKFPEVRVWNLSLSMAEGTCTDFEQSYLASKLDDLARSKDVLFVVAAGNYVATPQRSWPPDGSCGEDDRICPPADAINALTVGSIAHTRSPASIVRPKEPSPFSRRGPGPGYLVKPDLAHFGGNCSASGDFSQTGILSLGLHGTIVENIGTSFSCPLVASLAGCLSHELSIKEPVPPALLRALLIHSAAMNGGATDPQRLQYEGFGVPGDLPQILHCAQSAATMILQVPIIPGFEYHKSPFPMPTCLGAPDTGLEAEILMTLAYAPPSDRRFGVEFCRTNISASLGTMRIRNGKPVYQRELYPAPEDVVEGYEEKLVKHGYKWSPVKIYRRTFTRGPVDLTWRLSLEYLARSEEDQPVPQDVFLIITIKDPKGVARVYDELVRLMVNLNWGAQDLQIRSRLRT